MIHTLLLLTALTQAPASIELLPVPCGKGAHEPQLAVRADGQVALVWGTREAIYAASGTPDQPSFDRAQRIAEDLRFFVGMRRGPRVAWSGANVVVAAIGGERGGGKDGDVFAWRTTADGSWSSAVRVNSVAAAAREGLHALASGPNGELFCAWIDLRAEKPALYGAASRDGGATWKDERALDAAPNDDLCPCCAPSVAFDERGRVHVMWRGSREGARDLLHAISENGGKSFASARKLGKGTWKLNACPMDGGALVPVVGDKLLSVWRREKSVYLSTGADERLLGTGEQPWIARSGDDAWVVWLERRGGNLWSLAPGAREPSAIAETANDPVIASALDGKGPVFAAWETGEGDASEIRLARLAKH